MDISHAIKDHLIVESGIKLVDKFSFEVDIVEIDKYRRDYDMPVFSSGCAIFSNETRRANVRQTLKNLTGAMFTNTAAELAFGKSIPRSQGFKNP